MRPPSYALWVLKVPNSLMRFAMRLFAAVHDMGVHTAIETNGFYGERLSDEEIKTIDLVILDMKAFTRIQHELVTGGMSESKVLRVVGLSDSMHLDNADPRNPINRRISIILLNRQTQERIERENSGDGAAVRASALKTGTPGASGTAGASSEMKPTSFKPTSPTQ